MASRAILSSGFPKNARGVRARAGRGVDVRLEVRANARAGDAAANMTTLCAR
jgi:hypothetical protein